MKKIFVLLLSLLLILQVLPVYAANNITVYVQNYNSVSKELEVYVKSSSESFAGAEITLDDGIDDGFEIYYYLDAEGKGSHAALIDVSSLTKDGEYTLTVSSDCGGETEVDTKVINLAKTLEEKTVFNYENLDITTKLQSDVSSYEKIDDSTVKVSFYSSANVDYRLGWGSDGTGGAVNTEGKNLNPSGGNLTLEFEIMFQNGDDTETQEKPGAYTSIAFRQDRNKSVASGYPTNTATATPSSIGGSFALFNSTGKIEGSGEEYKTNIWYKCRIVFDMVTKDENGNLVGGLTYLVAKKGEGGYGDFEVQKYQANYLLNNLRHFRFEPRATSANCSITFKNISLTREEMLDSWYVDSASYADSKVNLKFTKDMGELTAEDIKLFNTVNATEIAISSITKVAEGEYEIITERPALNYGRKYELYTKFDLAGANGEIAFNQPEDDEDGDGFWKLAEFTTPKYALNVVSVEETSEGANVVFENAGIADKYAAVCWYDESNYMVDCVISPVNPEGGNEKNFARTNSDTSSKVKVIIFGYDNGADTIYEVFEN